MQLYFWIFIGAVALSITLVRSENESLETVAAESSLLDAFNITDRLPGRSDADMLCIYAQRELAKLSVTAGQADLNLISQLYGHCCELSEYAVCDYVLAFSDFLVKKKGSIQEGKAVLLRGIQKHHDIYCSFQQPPGNKESFPTNDMNSVDVEPLVASLVKLEAGSLLTKLVKLHEDLGLLTETNFSSQKEDTEGFMIHRDGQASTLDSSLESVRNGNHAGDDTSHENIANSGSDIDADIAVSSTTRYARRNSMNNISNSNNHSTGGSLNNSTSGSESTSTHNSSNSRNNASSGQYPSSEIMLVRLVYAALYPSRYIAWEHSTIYGPILPIVKHFDNRKVCTALKLENRMIKVDDNKSSSSKNNSSIQQNENIPDLSSDDDTNTGEFSTIGSASGSSSGKSNENLDDGSEPPASHGNEHAQDRGDQSQQRPPRPFIFPLSDMIEASIGDVIDYYTEGLLVFPGNPMLHVILALLHRAAMRYGADADIRVVDVGFEGFNNEEVLGMYREELNEMCPHSTVNSHSTGNTQSDSDISSASTSHRDSGSAGDSHSDGSSDRNSDSSYRKGKSKIYDDYTTANNKIPDYSGNLETHLPSLYHMSCTVQLLKQLFLSYKNMKDFSMRGVFMGCSYTSDSYEYKNNDQEVVGAMNINNNNNSNCSSGSGDSGDNNSRYDSDVRDSGDNSDNRCGPGWHHKDCRHGIAHTFLLELEGIYDLMIEEYLGRTMNVSALNGRSGSSNSSRRYPSCRGIIRPGDLKRGISAVNMQLRRNNQEYVCKRWREKEEEVRKEKDTTKKGNEKEEKEEEEKEELERQDIKYTIKTEAEKEEEIKKNKINKKKDGRLDMRFLNFLIGYNEDIVENKVLNDELIPLMGRKQLIRDKTAATVIVTEAATREVSETVSDSNGRENSHHQPTSSSSPSHYLSSSARVHVDELVKLQIGCISLNCARRGWLIADLSPSVVTHMVTPKGCGDLQAKIPVHAHEHVHVQGHLQGQVDAHDESASCTDSSDRTCVSGCCDKNRHGNESNNSCHPHSCSTFRRSSAHPYSYPYSYPYAYSYVTVDERIPSASVDVLYSSHTLEHVSHLSHNIRHTDADTYTEADTEADIDRDRHGNSEGSSEGSSDRDMGAKEKVRRNTSSLYPYGTLDTLHEWRRILRPGGTLLVSVPDIRIVAQVVLDKRLNIYQQRIMMSIIYGGQQYPGNTHLAGFTEEILRDDLEKSGFCHIRRVRRNFHLFKDTSSLEAYERNISLSMRATAC